MIIVILFLRPWPRALRTALYGMKTADSVRAADAVLIKNKDNIINFTTVMLATKVNWWLTNHHTGGKLLSGFISKVASIHIPSYAEDPESFFWLGLG